MTELEAAERGADVRFPPPLVFLISILSGIALRFALAPISVSAHSSLLRWAGAAIAVGGLGMGLPARSLFRRTGQDPKPWAPSPELVLTGPFRFTRHPMYVGLMFVQLGFGLLFNNLWISVLAPVSLLAVHFTAVLPEERYLAEKFGQSYQDYQRRVRRYL